MELRVADILEATGGELLCGSSEAVVRSVSIDSRTAEPGSLFVPLQGEHADGHVYIGDAFRGGAAGTFVHKGAGAAGAIAAQHPDRAVIAVADPLCALGDTAACWRGRFSATVAAITGSNEKTITEEMIWSIISPHLSCIKNPGNFNNLIGLPLSLFQLAPAHQAAILELGMSGPGEIRRLARISRPRVGLVTNVGPAHLEQLKTLEVIAAAKQELLEELGPEGTAIVNGDDARTAAMARHTRARVVSFGIKDGDIRASGLSSQGPGGASFELHMAGVHVPVRLRVPGNQFVSNALAAAAVAAALGMSIEQVREGLEAFAGVPGRMETVELGGGVRVINDAYNANPVSTKAALDALAALGGVGRRIAALGDMLELGNDARLFHREAGAYAAKLHLDGLFAAGVFAGSVRDGALEGGMSPERIFGCDTVDALAGLLKARYAPGDCILLKGSRKMKMEQVLEVLKK